jgi:hypothetical protein
LVHTWFGPAIEAGRKGWDDVVKLLKRCEETGYEGEDDDDGEGPDESGDRDGKAKGNEPEKKGDVKKKSQRMIDLTQSSEEEEEDDAISLHDYGAHMHSTSSSKRKRSSAGGHQDDLDGQAERKKRRTIKLDENECVTQARLDYLRQNRFLKEALVLMNLSGVRTCA